MRSDKVNKAVRVDPAKIVAISFLVTIAVGTLLLWLPISNRDLNGISFVNALFTATSATCVTGLVVADTGKYFTIFGQCVILFLLQVGGLGIMTMSTFFLLLIGKKLTLKDQLVVADSLEKTKLIGVKGLIRNILIYTFVLEFLGALVLFIRYVEVMGYSVMKSLYFAVFHAVSAFCNAGFSLYSNSLVGLRGDQFVTFTMGGLIFLGGLGFIVLFNLQHMKFWVKDVTLRGKLRLHTKIVLTASLVLICLTFIVMLASEWGNTLKDLPLKEKLLAVSFHSVTPRTAGFSMLPVGSFRPATLIFIIFMMFIGASPGSTGGGIKTCTLVVLLAASWAIIRGKDEVNIFRKAVSKKVLQEAICIFMIGLLVIFISIFCLLSIEDNLRLSVGNQGFLTKIAFEVFSAFGTVGLSTGITPNLSWLGKLIIIVTMFVGRVGPLTLALIVGRGKEKLPIRYPEEIVMVG